MKDTELKKVVIGILKEIGLEAKRIRGQNNLRTPDIKAWDKKDKYIIELKNKSDDPEEVKKYREALKPGKIVGKTTPTGPRNRLYAIITDGVNQLTSYDSEHTTFHIIWIHTSGRDPSLLDNRFRATLFGTQYLFSTQKGTPTWTCFYFKESSFYSHRNELDGAILTYLNQSQLCVQLCVNTLSPYYRKFSQSFLYRSLAKGLCNPEIEILKQDKNAWIADCNYDRKEEGRILKYLREKHNLDHLDIMPMNQVEAMMILPIEEK